MAEPVKHGAAGIYSKVMVTEKMLIEFSHMGAIHMLHFAAFFALDKKALTAFARIEKLYTRVFVRGLYLHSR